LKFDIFIDSYGIIHLVLEGGYIVEFRDTMRMTGVISLDKFGKDFKVPKEYSKPDFPIFFMTPETLYYKGNIPESKYCKRNEIPDDWKDVKEFDAQKKGIEYNIKDCVSLSIAFEHLAKQIYKATELNIFSYITAPSLAYKDALDSFIPISTATPTVRSADAFDRSSVQGGRCFIQKPYFKSSLAVKIMKAFRSK
jgi:hypothetical protein